MQSASIRALACFCCSTSFQREGLGLMPMKTIFVWGTWHWYGYVEYYKIYYAVLGMWIFNMTFSTIWLRYFEFGPMEWVWRSLTYWKKQPMRIRTAALVPLAADATA